MNVEAANDVDLNYSLNPRSIVSMSVGIVWASILILVYLQGKIRVGEWCCEVVGSCEVQQVASCSFLLPRSLIKTCMCVCLCSRKKTEKLQMRN